MKRNTGDYKFRSKEEIEDILERRNSKDRATLEEEIERDLSECKKRQLEDEEVLRKIHRAEVPWGSYLLFLLIMGCFLGYVWGYRSGQDRGYFDTPPAVQQKQ